MMRRLGRALVAVIAFLILVAEVQRADDQLAQRENAALYGVPPP